MRPGQRGEFHNLTLIAYNHYQRRIAPEYGGGEYTNHVYTWQAKTGRFFEYSGSKHFLLRIGDVSNLRATLLRFALSQGRSVGVLGRPKLLGEEFAQMPLI